MIPDPDVWFQRRPGGPWYKIGKANNGHRIKICARCGSEFLGQPKASFCSVSCGKSTRGRRSQTVVVTCQQCGADFETKPSQVDRGRGKYCSIVCRSTASRTSNPGYGGMHHRVRREKGSASFYPCVDCGEEAEEWSYDGLDPDELVDRRGTYSLDPEHYQPRCVPCHAMHDTTNGRRSMAGETHPNTKLTDAQVAAIRASIGVTQEQLAALFGVHQTTISAIRRGAHRKEK